VRGVPQGEKMAAPWWLGARWRPGPASTRSSVGCKAGLEGRGAVLFPRTTQHGLALGLKTYSKLLYALQKNEGVLMALLPIYI
jgi:hypothetical protein